MRGSWWRSLERLNPKKYNPLLTDYGVAESLKILNKEGRDTKPNTKHRRLVPAKNAVKHPPKNRKRNKLSINNLLPFAQDGYSMLRTKSIALPYVECINGPILLTAPHGLKLAGPRRSHKREKYTSEIVMLLAKKTRKVFRPASEFYGMELQDSEKV